MAKHIGHECVFFNEHAGYEKELDPFENEYGYVEDVDFWQATKEAKEEELTQLENEYGYVEKEAREEEPAQHLDGPDAQPAPHQLQPH